MQGSPCGLPVDLDGSTSCEQTEPVQLALGCGWRASWTMPSGPTTGRVLVRRLVGG